MVGALRMVQAVVPGMRERGSGVVVNVSSVNGRVASPLGGTYAASKFALEAMGETLHFELGHFGIRVVLVEPGYIAPGMKDGPEWGMEAPYDELGRQWAGRRRGHPPGHHHRPAGPAVAGRGRRRADPGHPGRPRRRRLRGRHAGDARPHLVIRERARRP